MLVDARRRHRGAIIAAVLLLVIAGTVGALVGKARAETVYESSAVVMVLPPGAGNKDAKLNPFVNLDNNMIQLALAMTTALNSAQTVNDLGTPDPSITEFTADTVKTSTATAGSGDTVQVRITVRGTDGEVAQATVGSLVEYSRTVLRRMQTVAGVRGATFADEVVIVPPTPPETVAASTFRAIVTHAMIGIALAALVVAMVAGLVTAIGRGRRARSAAAGSGAVPDGTDAVIPDGDAAEQDAIGQDATGQDAPEQIAPEQISPGDETQIASSDETPGDEAATEYPATEKGATEPTADESQSGGPDLAVGENTTNGTATATHDDTEPGQREPHTQTVDHDGATDPDSAASGVRP